MPRRTKKKTVRLLRKSKNHESVNCNKVTTLQECRRELNRKQLCFNCTGTNHEAPECRCSVCCKFCNRRHHSSICPEKTPQQSPEPMLVRYWEGIRYLSGGRCECGWNLLPRAVRLWCWKLLHLCSLAPPHGETDSSNRV